MEELLHLSLGEGGIPPPLTLVLYFFGLLYSFFRGWVGALFWGLTMKEDFSTQLFQS